MLCELCRRSKGVKINSVNIQHNEALQKLAKNIRGEYKPTQETQLLEICEQCEQNVMKKFKSESIEESFKDNNTELRDFIMNTEEVKPKKPKIEKDTLADDNIQQRQESALAEDKCSIKDNIATIKTKEISNSVSNEAELEDNTKTECQEALHDSVEVFDIIVKEEPRLNDIDDDDDDDDDDDPDQMMTENNEDSKKNITSENLNDVSNDGSNDVSNDVPNASKGNETIKECVMSGAYKIVSKRGRSKVWNVYGKIENSEGVEIKDRVCCRTCFSVLKYDPRTTSNLVKHRCYFASRETNVTVEVNNEHKKEAVRLFSQWSIDNCRPYQLAEDSGLKQFAKFMVSVGVKYGATVDIDKLLPQATTVSRNIRELFNFAFAKLKREIGEDCNHGYGLTSDIWTDNYLQQSYISLTIHYIKNGQLNVRLLGLNSMDGETSTDIVVRQKTERLLNLYDCSLEDAIMVTDTDSKMVAEFNHFKHIYCINHLLNNVVEKSIKQVDEIADLCNLCTSLVNYLKKSGSNCSLITTLKSFSPTRWNTVYYLLDSIEKNCLEIRNILQAKNQLQKIDKIDMSYLKGVVNVLKPFEEASKKLEGEKYATLHLVHPFIDRLKNTCTANNEDIDVIKRFKDSLTDHIQTVVMPNLTITHKIALFLFPPANKLLHFSDEERTLIKLECTKQLKTHRNPVEDAANESSVLPETSSIISSYFTNFATPAQDRDPDDKIEKREIMAYENLNIPFEDNFDVIQWWNLRQSQFPLLYRLSCKILSTPASSASSERVFSLARHVLSETQANISSNASTFNQIIFLHFNSGK